jgi:hypothetical protein
MRPAAGAISKKTDLGRSRAKIISGMEIILSSLLATLSYLPFRLVARVTIAFCALLFVVDPYPGSRLISLIATGCVLLINRARRAVGAESHGEG